MIEIVGFGLVLFFSFPVGGFGVFRVVVGRVTASFNPEHHLKGNSKWSCCEGVFRKGTENKSPKSEFVQEGIIPLDLHQVLAKLIADRITEHAIAGNANRGVNGGGYKECIVDHGIELSWVDHVAG